MSDATMFMRLLAATYVWSIVTETQLLLVQIAASINEVTLELPICGMQPKIMVVVVQVAQNLHGYFDGVQWMNSE